MRPVCALVALAALTAPVMPTAAELFDQAASAGELLETTLKRPAAELAAAQVLRGTFVQRRSLGGLPHPLVSSGEFILARDEGILWKTRVPFASEVVLTKSGMILRDGASQSRVASTDQPALRAALDLFVAVFALDLARLGRSFDLYAEASGEHWQLGLKPKQASMAEVFTRAVVTGSRHVERVVLEAPNGDRTEIELASVVARSGPLEAHEAGRFR